MLSSSTKSLNSSLKQFGDRKIINNFIEPENVPNLIEVQRSSYEWFIKEGLKELFEEIGSIRDLGGRNLELSF